MHAADFLDAADRLPWGSLNDIAGHGGIVVVAPHPDDESLGCGGLIATAVAEGRPVRVVVVSDGVGSHPNSATYPPERLRALREGEVVAAVQPLGLEPDALSFLRLPDRFVPSEGKVAEEAADALVATATAIDAGTLAVTWRHDPHCDHQAAYAIARMAGRRAGLRVVEYTVWGRSLAGDAFVAETPRGWRLDIARQLERKQAAIRCHRSQLGGVIDDDPEGFRLEPSVLERFARPFEVFMELTT